MNRVFYLKDPAGIYPVIICFARHEGGAYNKIARELIAQGYPDPRPSFEFDEMICELERDEGVVVVR